MGTFICVDCAVFLHPNPNLHLLQLESTSLSYLSLSLPLFHSQGWEESVDAAVSHLLRTCLSRSPKDQAISLSTTQLSMPKDTTRLKKHITLLCDRIGKGGRLSLSSEANHPTPVMMPGQKLHARLCKLQLKWLVFNVDKQSVTVRSKYIVYIKN